MPKYILLIDDDNDDAEMFAEVLTEIRSDVNFSHHDNGMKALDQLQRTSNRPDIIFLDINMPVLDGWQCLREIKNIASFSHIPIVMYSTAKLGDKGLKPADVGAAAFFTKPDSYKELRTKLTQLFENIFSD